MDYANILKKIAQKEIFSVSIMVFILLALLVLVWIISIRDFKKTATSSSRTQSRKKTQKGIIALILLTLFSISIVLLCSFDVIKNIGNIYKDINEKSYTTYNGSYYISSSAMDVNPPAPTTIDVNLDNNETLYLYVDLLQWTTTVNGERTGKIIYGKNSHIIVYISNS